MRGRLKKPIIIASLILLAAGATVWWWNADPELRWGYFRNQYASCINCRHQFVSALRHQLHSTGERWLPRGGATPADSLAQICTDPLLARCFTSHALQSELHEHYEKHGTLTYDFMCYRYNEGLSVDDPEELIVFYFHKPTRWSSWGEKENFVGRPVMTLDISPAWDFLPEQEFQERQKATLQYIRDRTARQSDVDPATSAPLQPLDPFG